MLETAGMETQLRAVEDQQNTMIGRKIKARKYQTGAEEIELREEIKLNFKINSIQRDK